MTVQDLSGRKRLIIAVLLPLTAFALQSIFWAVIRPFAWLLFFPAVFFSSWIGGLTGGVIATLISTPLAWWAFIPREHSFALENPLDLASIGLFTGMGFLFGFTQERVKKADLKTAEALAAVRSANEQLQGANERIEAANRELEEANRELEAFSYSVSHDLRAPLRSLDGFTTILLERHEADLPAEARRYLGIIHDSAGDMGRLIDALLAFSQLGRQELTVRRVDPAAIVREALADLEAAQAGRSVEIGIGELPSCRADPRLLRQVFANLLDNALKFTRDRETARIEVGALAQGEDGGEIAYYVRDNGAGFDMRYADKLFGVFQRLHRVDEFEGTGVGLATVARIVHRHGGRVWAEGEVDGGATFYFTMGGTEP